MQYLFLDFETYYDDVYTLRKMTPLEYALDPRFEAIGCAFADVDGQNWWVDGPDLPDFFDRTDWRGIFAVSHNALFDMVVLATRYGAVPAMYGDTLGMARNQLAHKLPSFSLEKLVEYYGMPPKHTDTLAAMKGVNFQMLQANPGLHAAEKAYGCDDVMKCREIFGRLIAGGFPPGELDIVDLVVRMAAVPQLELDQTVLAEHLAAVKADKQALLAAVGNDFEAIKTQLMSDRLLAVILWRLGVKELPRKISKTTGLEQLAFAKTDKAFTALLEHPNPRVQAYVAARLGHKSTLEESRTERLLSIAQMSDKAPVPLRYSGAHTHRFSGDWKINLQNLPNNSRLRQAFRALNGRKVVSIDASQIEARLNAVLSGQNDLVDDFRRGVDVYSKFAEEDIYHYPVDKAKKVERFVGKQGILSLGYGASPPVFQNMVRVKSDPAKPIILQDSEAISIVYLYRARFKRIVENWRYAGNVVMPRLAFGDSLSDSLVRETVDGITGGDGSNPSLVPWGPLVIKQNRIVLPNGNCLYYPDLHREQTADGPRWVYKRANQIVHLYGAKLVENVIQALSFVHIMDVAKRVYAHTNGMFWPAHQVHDELIYVVQDELANEIGELVAKEMSVAPWWMPTAPLAAEWRTGDSYGDLK